MLYIISYYYFIFIIIILYICIIIYIVVYLFTYWMISVSAKKCLFHFERPSAPVPPAQPTHSRSVLKNVAPWFPKPIHSTMAPPRHPPNLPHDGGQWGMGVVPPTKADAVQERQQVRLRASKWLAVNRPSGLEVTRSLCSPSHTQADSAGQEWTRATTAAGFLGKFRRSLNGP
jgi:hypothetical protein